MNLVTHGSFHSRFLPDDRDITVFLPPGYEASDERYPVLYLHDGQNLFDPEAAFVKGQHWRVGETAMALIEAARIPPLIIVGIDNAQARRLHEYTPTHDRRRGGGGAEAYGHLIVRELKPFVDARYRTRPDAANTGLGGSSLGGLVSLYLGFAYPDVFSRLAVMSPSVWWDRRAILRNVRHATPKPRVRIWLDIGTREGRYHVQNARLLEAGLLKKGWVEGEDLHYEEVPGGTHSEGAWAERFGRALEFLFARGRNGTG
ncbi:MAG TPA: alpha/beta hydrolase-fold protein [Vicinamibacterales bacterium]|nr:alpha/beta hydrolase-fold protein [Vicinamibacterales bacterium]